MTPERVGIVCALEAEARHLGALARRGEPLATLPDGTLLVVSGMGSEAAARGARTLIDAGATALASWGMAGGLDPALAAGAIVLPGTILSMEGGVLPTTREWRDHLNEGLGAGAACVGGTLLSGPRAVGSIAGKAEWFRRTGAAAVDMESFAIAQAAADHRLPFIAVRVIVDGAADTLPRAVTAAADREGHLHMGRLIGALAATPADLGPLLRLAGRYRAASRSLATLARARL